LHLLCLRPFDDVALSLAVAKRLVELGTPLTPMYNKQYGVLDLPFMTNKPELILYLYPLLRPGVWRYGVHPLEWLEVSRVRWGGNSAAYRMLALHFLHEWPHSIPLSWQYPQPTARGPRKLLINGCHEALRKCLFLLAIVEKKRTPCLTRDTGRLIVRHMYAERYAHIKV
jgi:hypothetical protein